MTGAVAVDTDFLLPWFGGCIHLAAGTALTFTVSWGSVSEAPTATTRFTAVAEI
jgi:hypothetical protein